MKSQDISKRRAAFALNKPHIYFDPIMRCWNFRIVRGGRCAGPYPKGANVAALDFCRRMNCMADSEDRLVRG